MKLAKPPGLSRKAKIEAGLALHFTAGALLVATGARDRFQYHLNRRFVAGERRPTSWEAFDRTVKDCAEMLVAWELILTYEAISDYLIPKWTNPR